MFLETLGVREKLSLGPSVVEKFVDSRYRYDNDAM